VAGRLLSDTNAVDWKARQTVAQATLKGSRSRLRLLATEAYPVADMAAVDLDRLFESLLYLSPAERAQVKERIEQLDPAPSKTGGLRALAGVISAEDAELMRQAIEDCERIDPRGW
jgi:hypothetical protein